MEFFWAAALFAALAPALWIGAGFLAWRREDGSKPGFFCYHDIVSGTGAMGDGVTCTKCGLDTYDAFDGHLWIFRLLGRVTDIGEQDKKERP